MNIEFLGLLLVATAGPNQGPVWEHFPHLICRADKMVDCSQTGCEFERPTAVVSIDFDAATVKPLGLADPYRISFRDYHPLPLGDAWGSRILDSTGLVWTFDNAKTAAIGDAPEIAAVSARAGFGKSLTYWYRCSPI